MLKQSSNEKDSVQQTTGFHYQVKSGLVDNELNSHKHTSFSITGMYQRFEHYRTLEDEYNINVDSIKLTLLQYEMRHIISQKVKIFSSWEMIL